MVSLSHFFDSARFVSSSVGAEGALVYFYYTNTTTLAPIYADSDLLTPISNPVLIPAGGILPSIFLDASITYRRRIVFSSDGSVYDVDPVVTATKENSSSIITFNFPEIFNVSGSPITDSGTLDVSLMDQAGSRVLASPSGGGSGTPIFRALVPADIPSASVADIRKGVGSSTINPSTLSAAQGFTTLVDATTVSWDLQTGFNAVWVLGGNRTLSVSNPKDGWVYTLRVVQDSTGSRTITWPSSFKWGAAGAPTLSTLPNKQDIITIMCINASTPSFIAFLSGKGF